MLKIHDYRCTGTSKVFERMVEGNPDWVLCSCGVTAKRLISPVQSVLDPFSGHFPSATAKWAKAHEDGAKTER